MKLKSIGLWLIIAGILGLVGYFLYKLLSEGEIPLFIKIGMGLIVVGIIVLVPSMLKEAKKVFKNTFLAKDFSKFLV